MRDGATIPNLWPKDLLICRNCGLSVVSKPFHKYERDKQGIPHITCPLRPSMELK